MRNLRKSALVVCLFAFANMFGQAEPEVHFETVGPETLVEEISYEYLLAHKVFLREKPSLRAKKITLLDIGTPMVVREESQNSQVIDGIKSNWYRVEVGEKSGWVWGGMIAQKAFGSIADNRVKFVYGYEASKMNKTGIAETKYQLRAFTNGRQLDKIVIDSLAAFPTGIVNIGNKGLFNVEDIITIDFADANSDNTIGKNYIFWNNGKFTNVASLVNYSTKAYSKSEYFVFPSDMQGITSTVALKTTISDHDLSLENEIVVQNVSRYTTLYTWNGYQFAEKEQAPVQIEDDVVVTNL